MYKLLLVLITLPTVSLNVLLLFYFVVIDVKNQNGTGNQLLSAQLSALDVTGIISQLEKLLGCALSTILETEMKKVYDDLWTEVK